MNPTAIHGWLLDTHAMLWMLYDDRRLSKSARQHNEGDLPVHFSTVSFWEIALKRSGKGFDFEIEDDWDLILPRELDKGGILRIDLEAADCRQMEDIPLHHRDPFDRMLIAQAMRRRLGIISRDAILDDYAVPRGW